MQFITRQAWNSFTSSIKLSSSCELHLHNLLRRRATAKLLRIPSSERRVNTTHHEKCGRPKVMIWGLTRILLYGFSENWEWKCLPSNLLYGTNRKCQMPVQTFPACTLNIFFFQEEVHKVKYTIFPTLHLSSSEVLLKYFHSFWKLNIIKMLSNQTTLQIMRASRCFLNPIFAPKQFGWCGKVWVD